jgi:GLPGLI family protein
MKSNITIILLLLLTLKCHCQKNNGTIVIEYDFFTQSALEKIIVTANHKQSISKTTKPLQDWGGYEVIQHCSDVYKNYYSNTLICEEYNGNYLVKESLIQFNWKITNQTDSILGFKCYRATCKYRGRKYEAFFTNELNFKVAPWKFHGLPGTILRVNTIDNDFIKVEANHIEVKSISTKIENPYLNREFISWEEFTKIYKRITFRNVEQTKRIMAVSKVNYSTVSDLRAEVIIEMNKSPIKKNKKTKR